MASSLLLTSFKKLCIGCSSSSLLHTSSVMMAAPVKRKKKIDPMILRMRVERRRKRLSKAMRKMEKKPRIPRPCHELEIAPEISRQLQQRQRQHVELSEELKEERALMGKEWNRYAGRRHVAEIRQHDALLLSRAKALEELRAESFPLYVSSIQPDEGLLPFTMEGPLETPAPLAQTFAEQHIVDGQYEDVTKKFLVQYADTKAFMTELLMNEGRRRRKKKVEEEDD